jgi:hypothetical protein
LPCQRIANGKLFVAVSLVPQEKMGFSYHTASCTSKYTLSNAKPHTFTDHSTKMNNGTVDYQFLLTTNDPGFI